MIGGAFSASAIASMFQGCVAPPAGEVWKPDFLSVDEGKLVTQIVDIVIPPSDEVAGGVEALVPQFIDRYFSLMLKKEEEVGLDEEKFFRDGAKEFLAEFKKANGKSFDKASAEERLAYLKEEDKKFVNAEGTTWFGALKEITYRGFFNSEVGVTEVLKFDPVPGNYDGCVPLSEINGIWATIR